MLLEKVLSERDLRNPDRAKIKRRIQESYRGEEFTQAALEYCEVFGNWSHARWIKNLISNSESPDLEEAVGEWGEMSLVPSSRYLYFDGTSCELDGKGIRNVVILKNASNGKELRSGTICASKVLSRNIFGDSETHAYEGAGIEIGPIAVEPRDFLDWFLERETRKANPEEISKILSDLRENNWIIPQAEKDRLVDYYCNTRRFIPEQLIDSRLLETARGLFKSLNGSRLVTLPVGISKVLDGNVEITIKESQPFTRFFYENPQALVEELTKDRRTRMKIDEMRTRTSFRFPSLEERARSLLSYVETYERINFGDKRHRLDHLVIPLNLYQAGFIVSDEHAEDVNSWFEKKGGWNENELIRERDERYASRRHKKWRKLNERYTDRAKRDKYVSSVIDEIRLRIDDSSFKKQIWEVINGVVSSAYSDGRTKCYLTREQMLNHPRLKYEADNNFYKFIGAGFINGNFAYRDSGRLTGETSNIPGNFPDVFIGVESRYVIPQKVRTIAYDDAKEKARGTALTALINRRRIALDVIESIINDAILENS